MMNADFRISPLKAKLRPIQRKAESLRFVVERMLNRPVRRRDLIRLIKPSEIALEIGPLTNPAVTGVNVRYFDVLDQDGLLKYSEAANFSPRNSVPIDYVSPTGDLSIIESNSFDVVFSSHCIEHQPDLVSHLRHVERILRPNGRYLFVVPDHRYCFDHFIPKSTPKGVLQAFTEHRRVHTLESHQARASLVTHNDASRHWSGDHGEPAGHVFDEGARQGIVNQINDGIYVDVHAWQFTPQSFRDILKSLRDSGFLSLVPEFISETKRNTFEFCGSLKKATPGVDGAIPT